MTTSMKNPSAIVCSFLLMAMLNACGTTKSFTMDSTPKGALISSEVKAGGGFNISGAYGETPTKANLTFHSDDAKYALTAEKRGYEPSNLVVSHNSNQTVTFDLKKIDGVSEAVFKKGDLLSGSYTLLPAQAEVIIHSGVGGMDEKTYSPEVSKKVTEELNTELAKSLDGNGKKTQKPFLHETDVRSWSDLTPELNKYLSSLNPQKLAYYSLPPYINANVQGFDAFAEKFRNGSASNTDPYFLYIHCKCVSETTGRKVGNFALSLMGAALQGYGMAQRPARTYSYLTNANSLQPDSGTLVTLYVIDSKTSEVLYIDQLAFSDITDGDDLRSMVTALSTFPDAIMKK